MMADATRRVYLPWLGIFKPVAIAVESVAASRVQSVYYKSRPQERFANKYIKDMRPLYEGIIKLESIDKDKIDHDNPWVQLKKLDTTLLNAATVRKQNT